MRYLNCLKTEIASEQAFIADFIQLYGSQPLYGYL